MRCLIIVYIGLLAWGCSVEAPTGSASGMLPMETPRPYQTQSSQSSCEELCTEWRDVEEHRLGDLDTCDGSTYTVTIASGKVRECPKKIAHFCRGGCEHEPIVQPPICETWRSGGGDSRTEEVQCRCTMSRGVYQPHKKKFKQTRICYEGTEIPEGRVKAIYQKEP